MPPPIVTRNAAANRCATEIGTKCTKSSEAGRDNTAIVGMPWGRGAMSSAAMGMAAKEAKLIAEIHAACNGCARTVTRSLAHRADVSPAGRDHSVVERLS